MKTKPLILGALLAITVVPSLQAQSLTLTFSDTFTSGQLDRTKWTYGGGPIINSETEAYVPDALSFSPSGLTIRTDHRPFTQAGITQPYTSGEITTEGRFFQTYGYFEACMKLPKGKGTWPAFWLIPENGSWPPEIDTLENLGEDPFTAYTSFHYNSTNIDVTQADVTGGDFSAGYHIYAVAWIPQSITYYIDGVQVFQVTGSNVPSTPMYMILNTAVGDGSGWGGAPNAYSVFPNTTEVQYVHAYQYNNVPTIGPDKAYFTGPMLIDTTTGAGVDATHPITPASAGDSMTLSTSLILSASKALPAETVHVQILDFFSQSIVQDTIVTTTGALAAGSTTPLTLPFTVPAGLTSGIYNVKVICFAYETGTSQGYAQAAFDLASQFQIGSPLPPLPGPPPVLPASPTGNIDLSQMTFSTVPGRTSPAGTITIQNSGQTAVLNNNAWKTAALPVPYTVTANTVLEFDYSTVAVPGDVIGSLYGIGLFPAGATYSSAQLATNMFILDSNEGGGITTYNNVYSLQLGGTFHYVIPIGQTSSCLGQMTNLLLMLNDNAGHGNTETFSHIHLYEGNGTVPFSAAWAVYPDQSILLSSMAVSPQSVSLADGATEQFNATGSDGNSSSVTPNVTWTVTSGPGVINAATGLYTAPASGGGPFTVTATCAGITATANGTVTASGFVLFDDAPEHGCTLYGGASLVSSPIHSGAAAYGATQGAYAEMGLACGNQVTAPAGTTTLQTYVYLAGPATKVSSFMVQLGAPTYQQEWFSATSNAANWSVDGGTPTTTLTPNTWHLVQMNLAGAFGSNWLSGGTKLNCIVTQLTNASESVYMDDTQLQ